MANLGKVFKFEFLNLVTKRSFLLTVILVPLIPALLLFVLGMLNDDQTQNLGQIFTSEIANPLPIGVVDQSGIVKDYPDWLTSGAWWKWWMKTLPGSAHLQTSWRAFL